MPEKQLTAKELAEATTLALNNFSFNKKEFCETVAKQHRTLQEYMTKLCVEWLRYAANQLETGDYDGRNEHACKAAKRMIDAYDNK